MAAKKTPFRVVSPDEKPPRDEKSKIKEKSATITAAVETAERGLLATMRDKIATEIDNGVPAHTLAGLMKQLRELDKEIRAIDAREAESNEEPEHVGGSEDEAFDPAASI